LSIKARLGKIGITPGKKSLLFFILMVAVTLPMGHIYNTLAVISFVLFSVLSSTGYSHRPVTAFLLPIAFFGLMIVSLLWSPNIKQSFSGLSREASLLFIPLAFILNRPLSARSLNVVLKTFSLAMFAFAVYLIGRALVRYMAGAGTRVFFNNELASDTVSIYLATFFSLALFVFLAKEKLTYWGYAATAFLLVMVLLLSKRTIIITDIFIITAYYIFSPGYKKRTRVLLISGFYLLGAVFIYFGNLSGQEFPGKKKNQTSEHLVSVNEAWNKETFTSNDGFTGPSFRVYRARVLTEMTRQNGVFFTGCGINTSEIAVTQIALKDNTIHAGWENKPYYKLNFHNQYMEAYADLGIFGLALVIIMIVYNLVKGISTKHFIHIAFAILMISLFLTESFLWRQKGVVFFTLFYCLFNDYRPSGRLKTAN
jgi:O-antigen ligase